MTLDFIYPDAPIGAECRGVNLAEIGHDDFTALSKLFDERSVLCIRDQNLSESVSRAPEPSELFKKPMPWL